MEKIPAENAAKKDEYSSQSIMDQYIQNFQRPVTSSKFISEEDQYNLILSSLHPSERKETLEPYLGFFYKNLEKAEEQMYGDPSILKKYIESCHDTLIKAAFPVEIVIKQMNIHSEGKTLFLKNTVAALAKEYFYERRRSFHKKIKFIVTAADNGEAVMDTEEEKEFQRNYDKLHYLFSFFDSRSKLEEYIQSKQLYPHIMSILCNKAYIEFSNTASESEDSCLYQLKSRLQYIHNNLGQPAVFEQCIKEINSSEKNEIRYFHDSIDIESMCRLKKLLKEEIGILNHYLELSFVKEKLRDYIRWPR